MNTPIRGRGASQNPRNRFTGTGLEYHRDYAAGKQSAQKTSFLYDHSDSVISRNNSPDIPFGVSLNPYRGCEHGCAYCYARPTHEFLGFSAGLDFETKIMVKHNAADILRKTLATPSWKPQTLVMSGVTDPYQPAERDLNITRQCIEVLAECRHPLGIITKNYLVTRDIDLLKHLAEVQAVHVTLSITTLDNGLAGAMEPRTSRPRARLKAIRELADAGIPACVNIAPVIPGLNDHEMVRILEESKKAGAIQAGYQLLRLPYGVKEIFINWLEQHVPGRKEKVVNRILDYRDGRLNRSEFGERFRGIGHYADQIRKTFQIHTDRLGFNRQKQPLNSSAFIRPSINGQLRLFT